MWSCSTATCRELTRFTSDLALCAGQILCGPPAQQSATSGELTRFTSDPAPCDGQISHGPAALQPAES